MRFISFFAYAYNKQQYRLEVSWNTRNRLDIRLAGSCGGIATKRRLTDQRETLSYEIPE